MSFSEKIRVLIVDDSVFMRKLLNDLLSDISDIEVVGDARDGNEAVKKAGELMPDVITMDYNMPSMNGVEATEKILSRKGPLPSIIILSAYSRDEITEMFKGLMAGAVDFVLKPSGEVSLDVEKVKEELISKIRLAAHARVQKIVHKDRQVRKNRESNKITDKIVVIGASTGGPPVVEKIISSLPADLSLAILIVQHMPAGFTNVFSKLLSKNTFWKVKEAEERDIIHVGNCFVAPGGYHMLVEDRESDKKVEKIIHLTQEVAVNRYRPSIDVTMKSVANHFGNSAMGIILTGMGHDGANGMAEIHEQGGQLVVQSLETSVINSMPMAVIDMKIEPSILSPDEIIEKIIDFGN